jgi:hypothetical protein
VYLADGKMPNVQWHHVGDSQPVRWTPSIHMPRAASRILLEIVSVRVERLNACSPHDARAEGIRIPCDGDGRPLVSIAGPGSVAKFLTEVSEVTIDEIARAEYAALWESINGPNSWAANPWVWVVEFKRVQP